MTAGRLCNREVVVTHRDTSIAEAAKLMRTFHVGDLVVLEDEEWHRPVGLVTDRDIVVSIVATGLDPEQVTVLDVMTEELATVTEDTSFWDALAVMRQRGVRRLPVVNQQGGLEGMLTLDDVLGLISEAMADLTALVAREIDHEKARRGPPPP
jgi:CBS domain-containing protein